MGLEQREHRRASEQAFLWGRGAGLALGDEDAASGVQHRCARDRLPVSAGAKVSCRKSGTASEKGPLGVWSHDAGKVGKEGLEGPERSFVCCELKWIWGRHQRRPSCREGPGEPAGVGAEWVGRRVSRRLDGKQRRRAVRDAQVWAGAAGGGRAFHLLRQEPAAGLQANGRVRDSGGIAGWPWRGARGAPPPPPSVGPHL